MSNNTGNSLVEGLERLGLIASRIRQNQGAIPQIEIDIILDELRNLYMVALQLEKEEPAASKPVVPEPDAMAEAAKIAEANRQSEAAAKKAAEEKRLAEEAAAKKAAEEKRLAEEAAAKKAAEEKRLAEEAAAKKAAEEKRLAEEAAAKKAAEEKRLAEEAAAKKAAEEKRLAEEAAAKKAAEEERLAEERRLAEAKRIAEEKRLAEEAAAKKAAEAKRLAEAAAAAAIAAAEIKPIFAPEEPAKKVEPIMDPQMEKLAGNPNDELFADEPEAAEEPKKAEASLFDFISRGEREEKPTVRTLGDTLNSSTANAEAQINNRVLSKKVDDLRTIININDKFSFMSLLFRNNMKAYNDFILRLNALNDREEALGYVKAVAEEYKWDEGSTTVKSFYKIFDRKF